MKKTLLISFLFGFLMPNMLIAQHDSLCKSIATNSVHWLKNGEASQLVAYYSKEVGASLDEKTTQSIWGQLTSQYGDFIQIDTQYTSLNSGNLVVDNVLAFAQGNLKYRLSFNAENQIAGIFFIPYKTVKNRDRAVHESNVFMETKCSFENQGINFPALLCMPKQVKTKAIVVLVHGSGPNDMDETIGPNKVFFQLAHLLAEHGIASLRYDKRTYLLQQDTTIPSFAATLSNVVVNDAVAAGDFVFSIDSLQQYPMFVVGHSLGAHSVPFIISQSTHFQGGIMLAGNARPLEDIVLEQYKYLFSPGGLSKDEKNEIKRIQKQVKEVKKLEKLLEKEKSPSLPLTNDTNFWLSLNRYNALEVASSIRKPLLIVQGERDYQVTTVDFALWKKQLFAISNGNYVRNPGDSDPIDFVQLHQNGVDFILYPTLNHLFMTGSEASFPEEYNRKGNVSAILVSDMANWLQRQLR